MAREVSLSTNISLASSPRKDGYKPISDSLFIWFNYIFPNISTKSYRYLVATARRLDIAHRQLERAREAIDSANATIGGSPKWRRLAIGAIAECELAIIAMNRPLQMAFLLNAKLKIKTPFSREVKKKLKVIENLRDAYEHIDERAYGRAKHSSQEEVLSVFDFNSVFKERKVAYGRNNLSIDKESTKLLINVRDYVINAAKDYVQNKQNAS